MEFFQTISSDEARKIIGQSKSEDDLVILDVRTPQEVMAEKIGEPINLDFYNPNFTQELDKLDKEKTYLVYCRSGSRSSSAMEIMKELGFKKVYNLSGGIMGW